MLLLPGRAPPVVVAGGRPASPSVMRAMLSRGHSVLVCPGGVRECLYMEHGREAVYLSNRTGFVRIALQYGAPSMLQASTSRMKSDDAVPFVAHCILLSLLGW